MRYYRVEFAGEWLDIPACPLCDHRDVSFETDASDTCEIECENCGEEFSVQMDLTGTKCRVLEPYSGPLTSVDYV